MDILKAGAEAQITFDLAALGFSPSGVTFSVVDELGTQLITDEPAPVEPGATAVTITVPREANILAPGVYMGAREVEVAVAGQGAPKRIVSSYALESSDLLKQPQRSTVGRLQGDLVARQLPDLAGWFEFDEKQRVRALLAAHRKLMYLRLRDIYRDDRQYAGYGLTGSGEYSLHDMTDPEWAALDEHMRAALRNAQVTEAFEMLRSQAADAGAVPSNILSMRVGESTTVFRDTTGRVGVGARAMAYLRPYLAPRRLVRAS